MTMVTGSNAEVITYRTLNFVADGLISITNDILP
jgi:hypothetical protein